LALAQRAHLVTELAARGLEAHCVVVADDDNLDIARGHGFHTVERDNRFVGRKVNDGIEYAMRHGADYVVTLGSDDWVHADLFDRLPARKAPEPQPTPGRPVVWRPGPEVVTGREILIVDLIGGQARRCRARGRTGVIPWIVPENALQHSRGRPVGEEKQRGIDGSMALGLRPPPSWVFHDPHDVCRVDFKSDVNITPFPGLVSNLGYGPIVPPWDLLARRYPAHLVDLARRTHKELAR
jgi:hypothetical protein